MQLFRAKHATETFNQEIISGTWKIFLEMQPVIGELVV